MRLKPGTYRRISQLIPFGIIFLISGILLALVEKGILGESNYYPSTGLSYDFKFSLIFSLTLMMVGVVVGLIEVLFLKRIFIDKSFGQKILFKTLFYIALNYAFTIVVFPIGGSLDLNTSILDPRVWERLVIFITSFSYVSIVAYIAVTLIIAIFYSEINENIGQGVLKNFFTGKYHSPIEEERIFMFLDMKSSTTIAEKLGHIRYFEMLRQYYADLSKPIIHYYGEIYQYVGDEIVISWKLNKGLQENNCIECFYAMKSNLENQAEKYLEEFGIVPEFRAGFHLGKVTTGEIGVIKKDIIFTGDVLNTTSRIQNLCKEYNVEIIISGDLESGLNLKDGFKIQSLGENEIRGRMENMILYTVQKKENL